MCEGSSKMQTFGWEGNPRRTWEVIQCNKHINFDFNIHMTTSYCLGSSVVLLWEVVNVDWKCLKKKLEAEWLGCVFEEFCFHYFVNTIFFYNQMLKRYTVTVNIGNILSFSKVLSKILIDHLFQNCGHGC